MPQLLSNCFDFFRALGRVFERKERTLSFRAADDASVRLHFMMLYLRQL